MSSSNDPHGIRGNVDLSQIRSQSYDPTAAPQFDTAAEEHPQQSPTTVRPGRIAFNDTYQRTNTSATHLRPQPASRSTSFANTPSPRPRSYANTLPSRPNMSSRGTSFASFRQVAAKRKSIARTISSYSVYSNFAGERLDDEDEIAHKRPNLNNMTNDERKSYVEKRKSIVSTTRSSVFLKQEEAGVEEAVEDVTDVQKPKSTVGKAMFMFLKAFIGSGVLFLPKAFQNGGLALSIVLMVVIAAICFIAFLHLVKTQGVIGGSYGDMGGILYGQFLRYIVLFFICISQIGFVCSYFIFVSGNLLNVVDVLSNCTSQIEQQYYVWFPLIILIPLALVRHIARLSFAAIVADVFILFGLVCVIYFTSDRLHNVGLGPNIAAVNPENFALMIGTATFSFEGIGLIIPIVESMERPERFPFVLSVGMGIVCLVYILIGTLSYLAYGDTVQSAVIYNFPSADRLTIAVQLLYSLAICLTAPLMLFPALKIIENCIFRKLKSGRDSLCIKWSKNLYRVILCVACAAIAFGIGGDNLDKFVSLVGSVACVPLCFIFPGMFHLKIFNGRLNRMIDIFLIVFGSGILVYTLYVTCDSFVHPRDTGAATAPYCPR